MFRVAPLELSDMDKAAAVHRASIDDRLPWLAGLHTPEEDRGFFRDHVHRVCQVCGAFERDTLVGPVAFRAGWIDQLYVLPPVQGRGAGSRLLGIAKAAQESLSLWTFQRNEGARRFYEFHGFAAVAETDGAGDEAREPDLLYRWRRSA